MQVVQLLYSSTSQIERNAVGPVFALAVLLNQCLLNNPLHAVTGVLGLRGNRFIQILEGPEAAVAATFHRISTDPRHCDIELMYRCQANARLLPGWSMAFVRYPHELETMVCGGDAWRQARDGDIVRAFSQAIA